MVANDVEPSRLSAAQEALRRFVGKLPGRFRVGMIAFSSQARVAVPITEDRDLVLQGFEHMVPFGGTAIGDAVARALRLLQDRCARVGVNVLPSGAKVPPAAIVLMSDGAQNRGRLQPIQAALRAKKLKIPVYTVALGTPSGTIKISDGRGHADYLGSARPADAEADRARDAAAQFYAAASSARLNAVYDDACIPSLDPSRVPRSDVHVPRRRGAAARSARARRLSRSCRAPALERDLLDDRASPRGSARCSRRSRTAHRPIT